MIVPNKFFHTSAAKALRTMLTTDAWVDHVVDFGAQQIFSGATNYSCIVLLRRGSRGPVKVKRAAASFRDVVDFEVDRPDLDERPWQLVDTARTRLWQKLEARGEPLEALISRFGTGIQTGADRILLLTPETAKAEGLENTFLRPALRGRDVRRYAAGPAGRLMVFPYRSAGTKFELVELAEIKKRAPNTYDYLARNRRALAQRVWFGKSAQELSGSWHGLMYVEARSSFAAPHLVTPSLSANGNFARGQGDLFVTGTAGVTSLVLDESVSEDLYYFLALLNSTLITNFMADHSPPYQGGFYKYSAPYLKRIPIARVDLATRDGKRKHDALVSLAHGLEEVREAAIDTEASNQEPLARVVVGVEDEVDKAVCELYGLTDADLRIVRQGALRP
jgi:hypothetical protein